MKLLKYFESEGEKKSLKKNTCNLKYFKIKNEQECQIQNVSIIKDKNLSKLIRWSWRIQENYLIILLLATIRIFLILDWCELIWNELSLIGIDDEQLHRIWIIDSSKNSLYSLHCYWTVLFSFYNFSREIKWSWTYRIYKRDCKTDRNCEGKQSE